MTIHPYAIALLISFFVFFSASGKCENMPSPTTSEYFKTVGGGFINHGAELKYVLNFQVRKQLNGNHPWFATLSYENPQGEGEQFFQLEKYSAEQRDISVRSVDFTAIRNHKTYKITLTAFADPERTAVIAVHDMYVRFDVPEQIAQSLGIKILSDAKE